MRWLINDVILLGKLSHSLWESYGARCLIEILQPDEGKTCKAVKHHFQPPNIISSQQSSSPATSIVPVSTAILCRCCCCHRLGRGFVLHSTSKISADRSSGQQSTYLRPCSANEQFVWRQKSVCPSATLVIDFGDGCWVVVHAQPCIQRAYWSPVYSKTSHCSHIFFMIFVDFLGKMLDRTRKPCSWENMNHLSLGLLHHCCEQPIFFEKEISLLLKWNDILQSSQNKHSLQSSIKHQSVSLDTLTIANNQCLDIQVLHHARIWTPIIGVHLSCHFCNIIRYSR